MALLTQPDICDGGVNLCTKRSVFAGLIQLIHGRDWRVYQRLDDVYSGVPVRIGGLPLSACFVPGNENLTAAALTSLGLQPAAIQALARRSAIIQSSLHIVTNDTQMLSCIARHFPAVGYLDEPHETQDLLPCF